MAIFLVLSWASELVWVLESLSNTSDFLSLSIGNDSVKMQMRLDTASEILEMNNDYVNYDWWPWPYSDYYL